MCSKCVHKIQCTPRHVSSWTAATIQRYRGRRRQSDRHPQCDGEVSLRCQQELHTQGVVGVPTGKYSEDSNLAGVEAMQWIFLCLSIAYDRRFCDQLSQHGQKVPEHHHACTTLVLWLPVAQLPVAMADPVRGNLGSGCLQTHVIKRAGLPNIH
jgi:hypothetical protein